MMKLLIQRTAIALSLLFLINCGGGSDSNNPAPTGDVLQIASGLDHTCALMTGGVVKCWGRNQNGQLGLGDAENRGDDANEMGVNLPAVNLGSGRTAMSIWSGLNHSCAILDDNTLKCWGYNTPGTLGLGDRNHRGDDDGEMGESLPVVNLGDGRSAQSLSGGFSHTCAVLDNERLKCWGSNTEGQLGLGDVDRKGVAPGEMGDDLPTVNFGTISEVKKVALHFTHSCAILSDNSLRCWGENKHGKLGLGDKASRGKVPSDMGNNLPAVNLGDGRTVVAISLGFDHSCALLDNGKVKCWGYNMVGQLGLGDAENRGDDDGEMGDDLPEVNLGQGISAKAIAVGSSHSCAILNNDQLKCWGSNLNGRLGIGNTSGRGTGSSSSLMGDDLPTVDLGTGRTVKAVALGSSHSCALLDNKRVKCWGSNEFGQLGSGDGQENLGDEAEEMGNSLPYVPL